MFNINGAGTAAANLIGGADADTFNLNGNVFTGVINGSLGGTDTDLLTGSDDYQVTGADSGTSGEVTGGWTEIEFLTATAGADVVDFVAGGSITGTVDGLGGDDTFNITSTLTAAAVELIGGDGNDTYNLTGDSTFTGDITGGDGDDTVNFGTPTGSPPGGDRSIVDGDVNLGIEVGDDDIIDLSGSALFQRLTTNENPINMEQEGTIVGSGTDGPPPPITNTDTDMISGMFTGLEGFIGNNQGTLVGPLTSTHYAINSLNTGTFGNSLLTIADNTFTAFNIVAGPGDDVVIFATLGGARLSGGIPGAFAIEGFDGGTGTNTLVGSTGNVATVGDSFTLVDPTTVHYFTPDGAATRLLKITHIDSTKAAVPDTGNDTITFNPGVVWGGDIDAGGGTDALDLSAIGTAISAFVDTADAASMSGTLTNILGVNGYKGVEDLTLGAAADTLRITADPTGAPPTDPPGNRIDGGDANPGSNTLITDFVTTWVVGTDTLMAATGPNAGTVEGPMGNKVNFRNFQNLTQDTAGVATLTLNSGVNGTITAPMINLTSGPISTGGQNVRIEGDTRITTPAATPAIFGGGGGSFFFNGLLTADPGIDLLFNSATTLAGDIIGERLRFNAPLTIDGQVLMQAHRNIWDFNAPVSSNAAAVLSIEPIIQGVTGSNGVVGANGITQQDIVINNLGVPAAGQIAANRFGLFNGILSIGGALVPGNTPTPVFDGDLLSGTADQITIREPLETAGGNVALVGSNIVFAPTNVVTDVVVGRTAPPVNGGIGEVALIALGTQLQPGNDGAGSLDATGLIRASDAQLVRIRSGQALLASTDAVENSENIILSLGGGPVIVTQGPTAQSNVSFNVQSSANPNSGIDPNTLSILSTVAGLIAGTATGSFTGVTGAQQPIVTIFNPAAVLTILQAVSFLDASAFEEELSLFGIIGEGIAQSLDQCEDAEGCAPSVTEEELEGFINELSERVSRIEGMMSTGEIDPGEGQPLLAGYREELQAFMDYRTELQAYLARQEADEFGDDFGDEFDDVFEAEEVLEPDQAPIVEETPVEFEEDLEETFEDIEEPVEDEIPVDIFEDIEEAVETFEELPGDDPAQEPVVPDTSDDPDFDTIDDEFEELEEELDDSLLNKIMDPKNVNQLAGAVRVDRRGNVIWGGDIVLPTLHRRF